MQLRRLIGNKTDVDLVLADECPNSGEDSEEDVITDYLGSSHSECDRVLPIINGDLRGLNLHGGIVVTDTGYNTKDNTDKTSITMSEGGDEHHHRHQQQQHQQHSLLTLGTTHVQTQPNPLPIISITPHSPGVTKNYPVLGKKKRNKKPFVSHPQKKQKFHKLR